MKKLAGTSVEAACSANVLRHELGPESAESWRLGQGVATFCKMLQGDLDGFYLLKIWKREVPIWSPFVGRIVQSWSPPICVYRKGSVLADSFILL